MLSPSSVEVRLTDLISKVDEVDKTTGSEEQATDHVATSSLAKNGEEDTKDSLVDSVGDSMVIGTKIEESKIEDAFEDFVGEFVTDRHLRTSSTNALTKIEDSEVEDVFDNGNINMLDSLREQIKKEDEQRQLVGEERDQNQRSPSEFNMPFEIGPRDS